MKFVFQLLLLLFFQLPFLLFAVRLKVTLWQWRKLLRLWLLNYDIFSIKQIILQKVWFVEDKNPVIGKKNYNALILWLDTEKSLDKARRKVQLLWTTFQRYELFMKTLYENLPCKMAAHTLFTLFLFNFSDTLRSNYWRQDTGKIFRSFKDLYYLNIRFWSVLITFFYLNRFTSWITIQQSADQNRQANSFCLTCKKKRTSVQEFLINNTIIMQ